MTDAEREENIAWLMKNRNLTREQAEKNIQLMEMEQDIKPPPPADTEKPKE